MKPGLNARVRLARAPTQSSCDLLHACRSELQFHVGLLWWGEFPLEEHRPVILVCRCSATGGEGKKIKILCFNLCEGKRR